MLQDFKKFILRGNFIDLAIGFTVGAAFTGVAKSLVDDILMPVVAVILGQTDFTDMYLLLQGGTTSGPYPTLDAAQAAGAITLNYGLFINTILSLLIVGASMYALVMVINRFYDQEKSASKK